MPQPSLFTALSAATGGVPGSPPPWVPWSELGVFVNAERYVGTLYKMDFEQAWVLAHDAYLAKVGGVPHLAYLVATRMSKDSDAPHDDREARVLLLRVTGDAPLPDKGEIERVRLDAAKLHGPEKPLWDLAQDGMTRHEMSHIGLATTVVGTFHFSKGTGNPQLVFGCDVPEFFANKGMRVYKPDAAALARIVSFRDPSINPHPLADKVAKFGRVRYSSTDHPPAEVDVAVPISPTDMLAQRTAFFAMSRMGKTNTVMVIAKAIYGMRFDTADPRGRVGQIIFDPNGEYANPNPQNREPLRDVHKAFPGGLPDDVVTYGLRAMAGDPGRRLLKMNFYGRWPDAAKFLSVEAWAEATAEMIQGKAIIDGILKETKAKLQYLVDFANLDLTPPDEMEGDWGEVLRYARVVVAYRALLCSAGFPAPRSLQTLPGFIFRDQKFGSKDLLAAMAASTGKDATDILAAGRILGTPGPSWEQLGYALQGIYKFFSDPAYKVFNEAYQKTHAGRNWQEKAMEQVLGMLSHGGKRYMSGAIPQHDASIEMDYATEIYGHLCKGRLVIVDQSQGDEDLARYLAERIARRIFNGNKDIFAEGQDAKVPDILVYVEEAHNLLPSGSSADLTGVWVRFAKEGSKFNLGLVYSTQEPSSIMPNILKNTANWFIGHLNNDDEIRVIEKFSDFRDFSASIRRSQDKGFLRIKTMSTKYVIPTQVDRFRLDNA